MIFWIYLSSIAALGVVGTGIQYYSGFAKPKNDDDNTDAETAENFDYYKIGDMK